MAGSFTVRLERQPPIATTVAIERTSGSTGISVTSGATLTFAPATFDVPQTVAVAAAADEDEQSSSAVLTVSSPGAPSRTVTVTATDPGQPPPPSTGGGCGSCSSAAADAPWVLAALFVYWGRRWQRGQRREVSRRTSLLTGEIHHSY